MTLKKRSKKPLDPSGFLWALKRKMSSIQPTPFEFSTQQDVPEILQAVLDELIGTSTIAFNTVKTTLRSSITCNKCQCCSEEEQKLSIVPVPLQNSISCSINKLLSSEILAGDNNVQSASHCKKVPRTPSSHANIVLSRLFQDTTFYYLKEN